MSAPGPAKRTWWSQAKDGSWRRWSPVAADWEPAEGPPPPDEALTEAPPVVRDPWKAAQEGTGFGAYLRSREFRRSLLPRVRPASTFKPDMARFMAGLMLMGGLLGLVSWFFNSYLNSALVDSGLGEAADRPSNWGLLAFSVLLFAGALAARAYRRRWRP